MLMVTLWVGGGAMYGSILQVTSMAESTTVADISEVQVRLQALGYFDGECTGAFSDTLRTAIRNFQTANGLPVTGELDDKAITVLNSPTAVSKKAYLESLSTTVTIDMVLHPGESGKYVRRLQTRLLELGYFETDATGYYGEVTTAAVILFQRANNLPPTGIADEVTLTVLSARAPVDANTYYTSLFAVLGDSGIHVKTLQTMLQTYGYFSGAFSGVFGPNTQSALIAFQIANDLSPTGECDRETSKRLFSGVGLSKSEYEAKEAVSPLIPGDEGEKVVLLQNQLNQLGYWQGEIPGTYDEITKTAVKEFQYANGLVVTGHADSNTRDLLNRGTGISRSAYIEWASVQTVQLNDSGYSVELLQRRLNQLGYYGGKINGTFTKTVRQAVKLFQMGHQLEETGIADSATRRLMNSDDALTYADAEKAYYARKSDEHRYPRIEAICQAACDRENAPYKAKAEGPEAFSHAGFVVYCYKKADISLPSRTVEQFAYKEGNPQIISTINELERGDLVFFQRDESLYAAIYLGEKELIYASIEEGRVMRMNYTDASFSGEFISARRFI